ncbi:MAG: hypothetical protein JWO31_1793, partial [Phycisphaerales bacterium]|nr:hypothetical protein [Phycisphaerales bacterium]
MSRKPWGTVRRAARAGGTAVAALSLLAAGAVGWAWWHAGYVCEDCVELDVGGRRVELVSGRGRLSVLLVRQWPWAGPGLLLMTSAYTPGQVGSYAYLRTAERTLFAVPGAADVRSGRWQVFLDQEELDGPPVPPRPDNPPARVRTNDPSTAEDLKNGWRWS